MYRFLPFTLCCVQACQPATWQTEEVNFDSGLSSIDQDGDGWAEHEDCNDEDGSVHPNAVEICDGLDNDCDEEVDEDVGSTWYADADGDGYGDLHSTTVACDMPEGYVPTANDCDDTDANSWPGAAERCDDADNDCDGEADESLTELWYADEDGDGFGDASVTLKECDPGEGWIENSDDCADTDGAIHPDAEEVCDLIDNNCDGEIDEEVRETWYADTDGDGFGAADVMTESCTCPTGYTADSTDCDDSNAMVYPTANETCDEVDNDCDGDIDEDDALDTQTFYADADGDGFGDSDTTAAGCNSPSGYLSVSVGDDFDCDDDNAEIHPDAEEICDELDNDCDGHVDDDDTDVADPSVWYLDYDGDGYGTDRLTIEACEASSGYVATDDDCDDTSADVLPDPSGDCALGTTCMKILDEGRDDGDGEYVIDPDGWNTGLDPFEVYCEMDGDDPGWTEIAYTDDLDFDQHFSTGNSWQTLSSDFALALSDEQIDAIREESTEGRQKYEGRCEGVVHYYHKTRDSYAAAFGFHFHDGSWSTYGSEDYAPIDVEVLSDGCKSNGGEGGASYDATWFKIKSTSLPVVNVIVYDAGDSGEAFGAKLVDNSAWLR